MENEGGEAPPKFFRPASGEDGERRSNIMQTNQIRGACPCRIKKCFNIIPGARFIPSLSLSEEKQQIL
jgi:hypothetical protein